MATTQRVLDVAELGAKSKDELLVLAEDMGVTDATALTNLHREEVLIRLFQLASSQQALIASGILEVMDEGYGFLRQIATPGTAGDVYISQSQIRRFGLRTGDTVTGQVRPPKEGERYFGLVRVEKINEVDPEQVNSRYRTTFEQMTPIFPEQQIILEIILTQARPAGVKIMGFSPWALAHGLQPMGLSPWTTMGFSPWA